MVVIVVIAWGMMIHKRGVERWEGIVLIALWLFAVIVLSSGDEAAASLAAIG